MEETYINKITFKDLILKYLIEEILKEKETLNNDLHLFINDGIIESS